MKKLLLSQKYFHLILSKKALKKKRRINFQIKQKKRAKLKKASNSKYVTITSPAFFKVRSVNERRPFLKFIRQVEIILKKGEHVFIDLTPIEELHPCGTLIFLAKLEIWCAKYPGKVRACYPTDVIAEQLLQHVGALHRLGLTHRREITSDRVVPWHFHSGNKVAAAAYESLTKSVIGNIEHPERILFADCLNEAITNTVGHAYKFTVSHTPSKERQKWWIFSTSREDHVFVSIYDSGVTIPKSLRRKEEWVEFLKSRTYWKDSRLVSVAATTEKTSTKMPHRGKGLPEMVEFSKNLSSGGLSILSGRAIFMYKAASNNVVHMNSESYIPGTLVLWHIPFQKERKSD